MAGALLRRTVLRYAALSTGLLLVACASTPEEAYRLPPSSLGKREAQSRTFEAADESEILKASVDLLQDMEYNIDMVEYPLGILTASKTVDADDVRQKAMRISADVVLAVLAALSGSSPGGSFYAGADDEVDLTITLIVMPSLENTGKFTVRVTIQSIVLNKAEDVSRVAVIEDPVIYREIFEKLSKSLSLARAGR